MDPRVAEALWKAMQGHLPPRPPDMHPLGRHRLPIPDRDCFQGILVRLVTGCSWDLAARLCRANQTTLRARRTEWLAAKVFDKLVEEAIDGYDRIIAPGPVRGRRPRPACTKPRVVVKGPAPTPRTEPRSAGSGRSRLTCSPIPIGWVIDAGNRGDSILLEPTLQAVDSCWTLRPATWTVATTATAPPNAARPWGSPTSSAPRRNARAKRRSRNRSPSDCAGPLNAPTPGSQTLVSCAATPTGSAGNDWDRSHSPSPSS